MSVAYFIPYSQLEGVVTVQATLFISQIFPRCNDGNKTTLELVGSIYELTEHLIGVQCSGSRVIKAIIKGPLASLIPYSGRYPDLEQARSSHSPLANGRVKKAYDEHYDARHFET